MKYVVQLALASLLMPALILVSLLLAPLRVVAIAAVATYLAVRGLAWLIRGDR